MEEGVKTYPNGVIRDAKGRIAKGSVPVPGSGRRRGMKGEFAESLFRDLAEAWENHGVRSLNILAKERPHEFVKTVVTVLPKEVAVSVFGSIKVEEVFTVNLTGISEDQSAVLEAGGDIIDAEVVAPEVVAPEATQEPSAGDESDSPWDSESLWSTHQGE